MDCGVERYMESLGEVVDDEWGWLDGEDGWKVICGNGSE